MNIHIESVWWRAGSVDRVVGECRMTRSQLQVRAVKHCGLAAVSGATLRHLSHAHTRQRQDISRDFQKPYFVADWTTSIQRTHRAGYVYTCSSWKKGWFHSISILPHQLNVD